MKTYHWIAAVLGLLMFAAALWQLEVADSGLVVTQIRMLLSLVDSIQIVLIRQSSSRIMAQRI